MALPDLLDSAQRQVYTVSALTREIREHLESGYPDVWVEGEVSNLRRPASGHIYFTLKDEKAQLRAVLFKMSAALLRFDLEDGLKVLVRGRVTVYEPRGEYQISVSHVEPMGLGPLELAFQQTCERLEKEGLFDEGRKRPLPFLPERIGIVTSPTGAAIRDMLRVLYDRFPTLKVLIAPVRVQGKGAAREIARAVENLNQQKDVDVIIAGRGGGSIEDLWAFNEETVARAIFSSRVPVISAVGHEIDFTIADFVADVRAPTPTAAAEMAVPEIEVLADRVGELDQRLASIAAAQIRSHRRDLSALMERRPFRRPVSVIHEWQQEVDDRVEELVAAVRRNLSASRLGVDSASRQLLAAAPRETVVRLRTRALALQQALVRSVSHRALLTRERFSALTHRLDAASPLSVLGRGFSICRQLPDLKVLKKASAALPGGDVRVDLTRGHLICGVKEVHPKEGVFERTEL